MSTHTKYAYKRHNTWVYRRTYPQHLQPLLGSSLKQSLKTADAKTAKARVAELNQTFTNIVKEAEQHVSANTGKDPAIIPTACGAPADPRPCIERPRYLPVRLLGDRRVKELAAEYLAQQAERLRPGSHKAVRFALELLLTHCGDVRIAEVGDTLGRDILHLLLQLSPNVRKYRDGKGASLRKLAALSQELEPDATLTPQTQSRILKHMQQFLDWCVQAGELEANPWSHLRVRDRLDLSRICSAPLTWYFAEKEY